MERKLTDEQIEQLFAFTKKKFVNFYDLQVELVDHLASSIEEEMEVDSKLNFENALQKVYNRFGIFGFAKVVQERTHALWKKNYRLWFDEVKNFFTIPKVALTAVIFLGSYYVGNFFSPGAKSWIVISIWAIMLFAVLISYLKTKKRTTQKLLLTQYAPYTYFPGFLIPQIIVQSREIPNNWAFAFFILIIVIFEMAVLAVNKKVWQKAEELYPEAFKTA